MKRRDFLALAAAAPPVFGAPVPLPGPTIPGIYNTTMRIGVVAPLTGDYANLGKQLVQGVNAAVNELNDLRFTTDPVLVFNQFDDQATAAGAVVQAQFCVNTPDMVATIGHLGATPTLAALQTYSNGSMPLIVPTVTDDRITQKGYRNVFRLPTKDSDEGALLASYVLASGAKAPVVVTQKADYGPAVADGFVRRAGAQHINVPSTTLPLQNVDFARAADEVLGYNPPPDFVALAGNVGDLGPLMVALRAKGYTGRFVASQGFFDAATTQQYAKVAEGLIISTSIPYLPLAPSTAQDVRYYQEKYGALTPVTAYGYAAVQLIQGAYRKAQATTRTTISQALSGGGVYDTVTGDYTFGVYGDVVAPNCYFYSVTDGKFKYERQAHSSGFMLK
jgi:branched-chain amino acid transport system substrate-binding protein